MTVEVRPARADDVEGAYAVLCDAHAALYDEPQLTCGMLANMLAIGHGSVADAGGAIVGAGVVNRDFGRLWVLRAERRRGIGAELLKALERDATLGALRFAAPAHEPGAAAFLAANGYRRTSQVWLIGIDLAADLPPPAWPLGVAVRTFEPEDARAVKGLLDEAYAAEPDYEPLPFEDWRTFMLGDPSYDPTRGSSPSRATSSPAQSSPGRRATSRTSSSRPAGAAAGSARR